MQSSVLSTYNRSHLSFEKGKGSYLITKNGKKYLDFASGIAVNSLGHCHKGLVQTLIKQSKKIWHTSNAFHIPEQEILAKKLTKLTFADKVFFCNSGAESVEAAIKIARAYFQIFKKKKKFKIITIKGSFHGRTIATISASGQKKMIKGFQPLVDGFISVDFADHKVFEKIIDNKTAAIMVEPILGEGGIKVIPNQCLEGLRNLCNKKNILLIFDEVQCGVGRTGKFLATEWVKELKPNIVSIAKGIGGGFPLGALLLDKKTSKVMTRGAHGSTFGGNPLGMAIANEVLNYVLDEDFLDNIREVGYNLRQLIKSELVNRFPNVISGVRGIGLMIGIECVMNNELLIRSLINERLLTVKAGQNIIRILPPLILEMKHVDEAINKMTKAFESL